MAWRCGGTAAVVACVEERRQFLQHTKLWAAAFRSALDIITRVILSYLVRCTKTRRPHDRKHYCLPLLSPPQTSHRPSHPPSPLPQLHLHPSPTPPRHPLQKKAQQPHSQLSLNHSTLLHPGSLLSPSFHHHARRTRFHSLGHPRAHGRPRPHLPKIGAVPEHGAGGVGRGLGASPEVGYA